MNASWRLALRIVVCTGLVLSVTVGLVCVILVARAPSATSPEIFVQTGAIGAVSSFAWDPGGKTLATGNTDGTLSLWDASSGQLLWTLQVNAGAIYSVAWSSDNTTLASGGRDKTVSLWRMGSSQALQTLSGHLDSISSLAWNPNGKILASGSSDDTIKLWDGDRGQLLKTLRGQSGSVNSVAWSPNGRILASGSSDHAIRLWDGDSGQLLKTLRGHSGSVNSVAWNRDGKILASGSSDYTVKLWDAGNGQELRTIKMHLLRPPSAGTDLRIHPDVSPAAVGAPVNTLAWSPVAEILAIGTGDSVRLWDSESSQLTILPNPTTMFTWSPDGKILAGGNGVSSVSFCDAFTGDILLSTTRLPEGEWLAFKPGFPVFAGSAQGANYAAVRFDHRFNPVYPLRYYENVIMRDDLRTALSMPSPLISPKPIRYAWDNFPRKNRWLGVSTLTYLAAIALVLIVARYVEPARIVRLFFSRAGFERAESRGQGILMLQLRDGTRACAIILEQGQVRIPEVPERVGQIYIINKSEPLASERVQTLRVKYRNAIIPLLYSTLTRAIGENTCDQTLRELEEPFLTRTDPYDESRPIADPTWFYGRNDLLARAPIALRQGQHIGLFGLRKAGKTSVIHQLRARLTATPTVWIDCQGYPAVAEELFRVILDQLRKELRIRGVNDSELLPSGSPVDFRREFLRLYEVWLESEGHGPVILILDEVDKLFPDRRIRDSDRILSTWVSVFRVLRSLAQERSCLSVLATAYRPDVNRQNLLSPSLGENPMFMSFQEYFLGSFDKTETETMIREIGAWKDIRWTENALGSIYALCGGHPLVTRIFASDACTQGAAKWIDDARVQETAEAIRAGFHKHRIGRYYKESVWDTLQDDERRVLELLINGQLRPGDTTFSDAATNLEQLGLVHIENGTYEISSQLFRFWLERN